MEERRNMDGGYLAERPKRRGEGLIEREIDGEVVVYDLESHEAHCLNPEAARLWRACDGDRDGREILRHLHGENFHAGHEAALLIGLEQLEKSSLLETDAADSAVELIAHTSRRELLSRVGKVVAVTVALPAILSIVAPTPAEASTCVASGGACTSSAQCCSGLCNGTFCACR
jgi:hypothetical protein